MSPGRTHPQHLLWYVLGDLPDEQMRDILDHLERCRECREETAALRSTMRALSSGAVPGREREESRPAPPAPAEQEAGRRRALPLPDAPPPALRLMPRPALRADGSPVSWRHRAAALALGTALVAAPAAGALLFRGEDGIAMQPVRRMTLMPARRAIEPSPVLKGGGPWLVRVVLPYGSLPGSYRLRLARADGGSEDLAETVVASHDGALELILPGRIPAGRLRLTVESTAPLPPASYLYPFEAQAGG